MADDSSFHPDVNSGTGRGRPNRLSDLVLSAEPPIDNPPTPPYRQYPASIHSDVQSPPYRSRSQLQLNDMDDEKRGMDATDEKRRSSFEDNSHDASHHEHEHERNDHHHHHAKGVHYPEEFPRREKPVKFDSTSELPSRAPSAAPSEDEHGDDDDEYDWSTDDDEVDQEAKKFEQVAVGSKQSSLAVR